MSDENLTHTCCWCQSAMDPKYAMCGDCWERELKRRETERDHALDDLKAEIANHREDTAELTRIQKYMDGQLVAPAPRGLTHRIAEAIGGPMDSMIDILRRGLEDQGCFVRPMQYTNEEDSGALRVTTDDDRVFSVHFHMEG